MRLEWHSFLIPGIFLVAVGIVAIGLAGPGPLPIGAVVSGLFLLLAAVLKALADRDAGARGE